MELDSSRSASRLRTPIAMIQQSGWLRRARSWRSRRVATADVSPPENPVYGSNVWKMRNSPRARASPTGVNQTWVGTSARRVRPRSEWLVAQVQKKRGCTLRARVVERLDTAQVSSLTGTWRSTSHARRRGRMWRSASPTIPIKQIARELGSGTATPAKLSNRSLPDCVTKNCPPLSAF